MKRVFAIPAATNGTATEVHVTGSAATNIDVTDYLGDRMPRFFAAVLGMSFLVLMMVFRSILVPLKAVVMNVLSIAATYGVIVVVFQWGWGGSLLGIDGGPINPFIPLMLFAIVFGLSMDYEVFMLSRIREEYDRTGDATTSVADGLAVLLDATLVRMILVPATMALLGDHNWWMPRWLDRALPRLSIEKARGPIAPGAD